MERSICIVIIGEGPYEVYANREDAEARARQLQRKLADSPIFSDWKISVREFALRTSFEGKEA